MGNSHLSGWKEIAQYLGRGVRTVQRWALQYGLPVHHVGNDHRSVQATREELDCWIANSPILSAAHIPDNSADGELKPQVTEGATILVVDDYEPTLYGVQRMLQSAGFEVITASDGHQALSLSCKPSLIILDVNLPDISGFDLCRIFRGRPDTAKVPILFLSSTFRNVSAKQLAQFVGANDFLFHPITQQQLVDRVRPFIY